MGQGISVITQLLVPPFFLHCYVSGIQVYGEWIALSASVNYLGTLNYGIQTYASNEATILYNRGDVEGSKRIQASAFRLLYLLLFLFATVGLSILFVPLASWLKLKTVTQHSAAITLYLLVLQIGMNMIFSLLTNSYMIVGKLHRGSHWGNAQRLCGTLGMAAAIYFRSSFPVLAAVQLGLVVLFVFFVVIDVRRIAPVVVPPLRYGTWKSVGAILKPSGHFGLIAFAGFLTWQGPVILIQRVLGPTAVGLFALVRVVFQMSRQLLSITSSTISQDITLMVGQQHWKQLRRLYDLSERIVLFLIPIVSVGALLMCPFLFTIWLHKRALYDPMLCLLMAIVSAVLGIKEHKTQFQSSSNKHEDLSIFILCGYASMLFVSVFTMKAYGLVGFIVTWLVWEIIQTGWVLRLNDRLFPAEMGVTAQPIIRMSIFMTAAFALAAIPAKLEINWPLWAVVAVAIGVTSIFGGIAYFVFGVDEVRSLLTTRIKNRFAPST
jgi:O-antigen/teichoic acid export membrane protein